jgi:hypothetical protein
MDNNSTSGMPAIGPDDSLTILRDVSHVYETMKGLRRRAAKLAREDGHTYQALSEAIGVNRTSAFNLVHRDAA